MYLQAHIDIRFAQWIGLGVINTGTKKPHERHCPIFSPPRSTSDDVQVRLHQTPISRSRWEKSSGYATIYLLSHCSDTWVTCKVASPVVSREVDFSK